MPGSIANFGLVLLSSTLGLLSGVDARPMAGSTTQHSTRATSSAGCGQEHSFVGGSNTFSIESSGGTRSYLIHLPSSYSSDQAMPLLVAYHGAGGNPEQFEQITSFSDESVNPNMITVYPAGVNGNWEGPTYATPGVSDKVFTTDLVNHLKQNYCIDTSRVYAAGHSNGGGFVGSLACSPGHGGQFAAFAPVSAALYTDVNGNVNCHPARWPMPIMETHGTGDETIPYEGGEGRGGMLPAIPEWLSRWADRDQCETDSGMGTKSMTEGVSMEQWSCTAVTSKSNYQTAEVNGNLRSDLSGLLVTHVKMEGHSHDYPGEDDDQMFISPKIIEFLSKYSIP